MAGRRRRWQYLGWAVFLIALVAILLLGAWRAILYHRDGAHPSNSNAPTAASSTSPSGTPP